MKRFVVVLACMMPFATICTGHAQQGFFHQWENRVRTTSARQPGWVVPVVTPSSGIVQLYRADFVRQITPALTTTWNLDNGKGFNLIPFANTEVDVNLPAYIEHNSPKVADGASDFSMVLKYRFAASNAEAHNYMASLQLQGVAATGSYKNGSAQHSINPTLVAGKGFGNFDVQSSLGGTLPTGQINAIGRTIAWNTVAQYKVGRYFWPEVEANATFFNRGPNNGKVLTFVTPGIMISKIKLRHDAKDRLAFLFGGGMQIATSSFHPYNHAIVVTSRITF
ncbi:MAG: hypothetical protein KGK08_05850 [Acidobacteriota bacterium]|nr:hypothetical protein [Acidobacteriota bacterium]